MYAQGRGNSLVLYELYETQESGSSAVECLKNERKKTRFIRFYKQVPRGNYDASDILLHFLI